MNKLESLKLDYNKALARFYKMEDWCDTVAHEEHLKQYKNIEIVINNCNQLLNEIERTGYKMTDEEIMSGFR